MKILLLACLFLVLTAPSYALFFVQVGDYVWEDVNQNGIQDMGEPPVAGVIVNAKCYFYNEIYMDYTTTTDVNGHYGFVMLNGTAEITMTVPDGYAVTSLHQGSNINLDSDFNENMKCVVNVDELVPIYGRSLLMFDMGLVKNPADDNCRTIGFWKNNIAKAISGKKGNQVSKQDLITWLKKVQSYYLSNPILLGSSSDNQLLQSAYNVLDYNGCSEADKMLKQLLACELNFVSFTYSLSDRQYQNQLCRQAEDAYNSASDSELIVIASRLDWVNNQE